MSDKIAVSALCWSDGSDIRTTDKWADKGITGIEAVPGKMIKSWPEPSEQEVTGLMNEIRHRGFTVPAMQAFLFGKPGACLFSDTNKFIRAVEEAVSLAQSLECPFLIWGAPGSRKRGFINERDAFSKAVEILRPLCDRLHKKGISLLMEHVPEYYNCDFMNTPEQVIELTDAVASPGFGLHIDTGSLTCVSRLELMSRAGHVHASEKYLKPFMPSLMHERTALLTEHRWISLEMLPHPAGDAATIETIGEFAEYYINIQSRVGV